MQWVNLPWFNMQWIDMQWIAVASILLPCLGFVLWKSARFISQLRNATATADPSESSPRQSSCSGCSGCPSSALANRPNADFGIKMLPIVTLKAPSETLTPSSPTDKNT